MDFSERSDQCVACSGLSHSLCRGVGLSPAEAASLLPERGTNHWAELFVIADAAALVSHTRDVGFLRNRLGRSGPWEVEVERRNGPFLRRRVNVSSDRIAVDLQIANIGPHESRIYVRRVYSI